MQDESEESHEASVLPLGRPRPSTRAVAVAAISRVPDVLAFLAVALAVSVLTLVRARSLFDFLDMSAFLDAGYRLTCGQRIYVDFYYNAGPLHPLLHAFFFEAFGFTQTAVLVHLLSVNAVVMGATYLAARRHVGTLLAALLTALSGIAFYGIIAHPFYDQNASLFLVLGVALLEIDLPLPPAKRAVVLGLATGALVGLSALTKANTAAFGALAFLLPMALPGERLRALASFGAALAATVLLGILPFADPRDAFEQMRAFAGSTDRFGNLDRLVETLVATPFVPLLVLGLAVALARGREFVRANGDRLLRFLGLLLGSILATWTSSGNAETKFPLLGIQALYVVLLGWKLGEAEEKPGTLLRVARCACAAGLVLSFAYTISCLRLEASPWGGWHPSNLAADYSLETPAFRGWRCNRANGEGVDAAVRFLDANVPREDSLFVAPDGTIIYGLTGHDSYRKTPFIVHVGSPPRGQLMSAFRSHFYSAPPRWIVIHRTEEVIHMRTGDVLLWLGILDFFRERYDMVWRKGDWAIYRLKSP